MRGRRPKRERTRSNKKPTSNTPQWSAIAVLMASCGLVAGVNAFSPNAPVFWGVLSGGLFLSALYFFLRSVKPKRRS